MLSQITDVVIIKPYFYHGFRELTLLKSLKTLFGIGLVCWSLVGCSGYLDKKLQEDIRQTLKEPDNFKLSKQDIAEFQQLGMSLDVQNQYPTLLMKFQFDNFNKKQIPDSMVQQFDQELITLACSLFDNLSKPSEQERRALATVLSEDNVAIKFILQDKSSQTILDRQIPFSECPQFETFKTTN